MKEVIQKVKGTREFYPEDMTIHHWLYEQIKKEFRWNYGDYSGYYREKNMEFIRWHGFCCTYWASVIL